MFPLVSGIIGVVGAFLTLPFYAAAIFWSIGANDDAGEIFLIGSSFGVPALLQIFYFFAAQKVYRLDASVAAAAQARLRASPVLKIIGAICALAAVGWAGASLWLGGTQLPIALIGVPCMVASAHFNIHSLWLALRPPLPEMDI